MLFPVSPPVRPIGRGAGGGMNLLAGLVAFYKLEEASGTRVDSSGNGLGLTPTNAPGNVAGKLGNALSVLASSFQYVSRTSYTALNLSADFTVCGWWYVVSFPQNNGLWGYTVGNRPQIQSNQGGAATFNINGINIGIGGTLTTGAWHFLATRYRASDFFGEVRYNTNAWSTGTGTTPTTTTGSFVIGARGDLTRYLNGYADEVGVWNRRLSNAEVDYMYNAGSGRTLP